MSGPVEFSSPHDWELDKTIGTTEWYVCRKCKVHSSVWTDDKFPEWKGKHTFNPSGGCSSWGLGYDVPCELATAYLAFCKSADSFLQVLKNNTDRGLSPTYTYPDWFRKHCVELIIQSMVDQCNHPEGFVEVRLHDTILPGNSPIERVSCNKCSGFRYRYVNEKDEDASLMPEDEWRPEWWGYQSSLEKHVESYIKALQSQESIKNE